MQIFRKNKSEAKSIIRIYITIIRFIKGSVAIFSILSISIVLFFYSYQAEQLLKRLDHWSVTFQESLDFMQKSGFLSFERLRFFSDAESFVYDIDGNIITSNTEGLEGLNIRPSALYIATKNLKNGQIHIGIYPDFKSSEQKVNVVELNDGMYVTVSYSPDIFFPAMISGIDVIAVTQSSRVVYSNLFEWVGLSVNIKHFLILQGRAYLIGSKSLSQMENAEIAFFLDITDYIILGVVLISILAVFLLILYLFSIRLSMEVRKLRKEQIEITSAAEFFPDDLTAPDAAATDSGMDHYRNLILKEQKIIEKIQSDFIENRHLLELFYRFVTASGFLLERIDSEAGKRDLLQKKALHEKDVLMAEIHHRVKNNLQIISALLQIQSEKETDPRILDFVRSAVARIHSIAFVHEALYSGDDLITVSTEEFFFGLLRDLCMITGMEEVELKLDLDSFPLNLTELVSLGLIFSELIINSQKHAFNDSVKGEIYVLMKKEVNGTITVKYGDNGPGLPQFFRIEDSGRIGLTLVHDLVKQLGGTMLTEAPDKHYAVSFSFIPSGAPF